MGKLRTLTDREIYAGNYSLIFDGNSLASGVYFYLLKTGSFISIKKIVLLK